MNQNKTILIALLFVMSLMYFPQTNQTSDFKIEDKGASIDMNFENKVQVGNDPAPSYSDENAQTLEPRAVNKNMAKAVTKTPTELEQTNGFSQDITADPTFSESYFDNEQPKTRDVGSGQLGLSDLTDYNFNIYDNFEYEYNLADVLYGDSPDNAKFDSMEIVKNISSTQNDWRYVNGEARLYWFDITDSTYYYVQTFVSELYIDGGFPRTMSWLLFAGEYGDYIIDLEIFVDGESVHFESFSFFDYVPFTRPYYTNRVLGYSYLPQDWDHNGLNDTIRFDTISNYNFDNLQVLEIEYTLKDVDNLNIIQHWFSTWEVIGIGTYQDVQTFQVPYHGNFEMNVTVFANVDGLTFTHFRTMIVDMSNMDNFWTSDFFIPMGKTGPVELDWDLDSNGNDLLSDGYIFRAYFSQYVELQIDGNLEWWDGVQWVHIDVQPYYYDVWGLTAETFSYAFYTPYDGDYRIIFEVLINGIHRPEYSGFDSYFYSMDTHDILDGNYNRVSFGSPSRDIDKDRAGDTWFTPLNYIYSTAPDQVFTIDYDVYWNNSGSMTYIETFQYEFETGGGTGINSHFFSYSAPFDAEFMINRTVFLDGIPSPRYNPFTSTFNDPEIIRFLDFLEEYNPPIHGIPVFSFYTISWDDDNGDTNKFDPADPHELIAVEANVRTHYFENIRLTMSVTIFHSPDFDTDPENYVDGVTLMALSTAGDHLTFLGIPVLTTISGDYRIEVSLSVQNENSNDWWLGTWSEEFRDMDEMSASDGYESANYRYPEDLDRDGVMDVIVHTAHNIYDSKGTPATFMIEYGYAHTTGAILDTIQEVNTVNGKAAYFYSEIIPITGADEIDFSKYVYKDGVNTEVYDTPGVAEYTSVDNGPFETYDFPNILFKDIQINSFPWGSDPNILDSIGASIVLTTTTTSTQEFELTVTVERYDSSSYLTLENYVYVDTITMNYIGIDFVGIPYLVDEPGFYRVQLHLEDSSNNVLVSETHDLGELQKHQLQDLSRVGFGFTHKGKTHMSNAYDLDNNGILDEMKLNNIFLLDGPLDASYEIRYTILLQRSVGGFMAYDQFSTFPATTDGTPTPFYDPIQWVADKEGTYGYRIELFVDGVLQTNRNLYDRFVGYMTPPGEDHAFPADPGYPPSFSGMNIMLETTGTSFPEATVFADNFANGNTVYVGDYDLSTSLTGLSIDILLLPAGTLTASDIAAIQSWFEEGSKFIWVAGDSDFNALWLPNDANNLLLDLGSRLYLTSEAVEAPEFNSLGAPFRVVSDVRGTGPLANHIMSDSTTNRVLFHGPTGVAYRDSSGVYDLRTSTATNLEIVLSSSSDSWAIDQDSSDDVDADLYSKSSDQGQVPLMAVEAIGNNLVVVSGEAIFMDYQRMYDSFLAYTFIPGEARKVVNNVMDLFVSDIINRTPITTTGYTTTTESLDPTTTTDPVPSDTSDTSTPEESTPEETTPDESTPVDDSDDPPNPNPLPLVDIQWLLAGAFATLLILRRKSHKLR